MSKVYDRNVSVLDAARKRISWVFDNYENIIVSVSGGKDSTVLFDLVYREAIFRNRKIGAFYLDVEIVHQSTIDIIDYIMRLPIVNPIWLQVPMKLASVSSYSHNYVNCWQEGVKWLRERSDISTHTVYFPQHVKKTRSGITKYVNEFFSKGGNTAFFVGIRADESLDRFRAVTKNPTNGIYWCTKGGKKDIRYYPLYDWNFADIWTYIHTFDVKYNTVYDKMYMRGFPIKDMRVASLCATRTYNSLDSLQEFEPETYAKVIERVKDAQVGARYAKDKHIFNVSGLPKNFETWLEYRNFLVDSLPESLKVAFVKKFNKEPFDDFTLRAQIKNILLVNTKGSSKTSGQDNTTKIQEKWKNL